MATRATDKENTHIHINEENVGNITKPNLLAIKNFYQLKEKNNKPLTKWANAKDKRFIGKKYFS